MQLIHIVIAVDIQSNTQQYYQWRTHKILLYRYGDWFENKGLYTL